MKLTDVHGGVCPHIPSTRQGLSAQGESSHRPGFSESSCLSLWALPLAPEVFSLSYGVLQCILYFVVAAVTKYLTA